MSLSSVMQMPHKQFFWLARQADRLRAESDMRLIQATLAAGSTEGFEKTLNHLQDEMGVVYEWGEYVAPAFTIDEETGLDPEFDRAGLRALKSRHGA